MTDTPEQDIKRDRYKNRRSMAWQSFYFFTVMGTIVVLLGIFNEQFRIGILAMWVQIAFIMGLWATVVAGYMASVYGTDTTEIKEWEN